MKKIFFTVGPSQLYPTVPKHLRRALRENIGSLSHRSDTFKAIYKETTENLRTLLDIPQTHHIFFTASALEGMERTIQNTVRKHSFHFVNGSFSREFYQIAVDLGKDAKRFDAQNGEGFDFTKIKIPKNVELVTFVQNETSTGVSLPMQSIYDLKDRFAEKLFALDVVSSIPYVSIDFTKIDVTLFSVQKGFGLPAGLGVLIVNDKALKKAKQIADDKISIGSYHNFLKLDEFGAKFQTRETPNVLGIYLLGKVAGDLLAVGKEKLKKQTEEKADLIYNFFEKHTHKPYVQKPFRSYTTIVIDVKGESDKIVNEFKKHHIILAKGYGKRKDDHIRIANFPALTKANVKKLLRLYK